MRSNQPLTLHGTLDKHQLWAKLSHIISHMMYHNYRLQYYYCYYYRNTQLRSNTFSSVTTIAIWRSHRCNCQALPLPFLNEIFDKTVLVADLAGS